MSEPATEKVRAAQAKPHRWALWCSVGGSKPFANEIAFRTWSEDRTRIIFGLETHNTFSAQPDEVLELVPFADRYTAEFLVGSDAEDERRMGAVREAPCPHCKGSGKVLVPHG